MIIAEETVTADGAASHRQIKVIRPVNGNKSREEALVELHKAAKSHVPDPLKGARVVGRDSDGSFWVLPKNGNGHVSCNIRLIEQIHP
ncbi:hypothetical protein [Streptomyces mirabilis]|uniref:Uncharacterized protein n=1 Tax=Streptomyces mirabilis TaxID=68239 RepID=A0ABU3V5S9_9ACTN|nr:hypothetical protein [Streptomyces mirabilis]MCX5355877.1 hypothetical protein [Streptomyces mirabilis]MDU9001519.1 hypothetical protein [Streptomyces mirabilis]